jgi:hypothetical protein
MIPIGILLAALLTSFAVQEDISCWAVKKAVAQYGVAAAEAWARSHGFSDKEIEKARRCLK